MQKSLELKAIFCPRATLIDFGLSIRMYSVSVVDTRCGRSKTLVLGLQQESFLVLGPIMSIKFRLVALLSCTSRQNCRPVDATQNAIISHEMNVKYWCHGHACSFSNALLWYTIRVGCKVPDTETVTAWLLFQDDYQSKVIRQSKAWWKIYFRSSFTMLNIMNPIRRPIKGWLEVQKRYLHFCLLAWCRRGTISKFFAHKFPSASPRQCIWQAYQ